MTTCGVKLCYTIIKSNINITWRDREMGRYKEIIQMLGFEEDRYILEKKGIQEWIKQCGEDNVYEECRKIVANNRKKLKKVK